MGIMKGLTDWTNVGDGGGCVPTWSAIGTSQSIAPQYNTFGDKISELGLLTGARF